MTEINLLEKYPKAKRDLKKRAKKTPGERKIAKKFGKEYFDGDRKYGYGGYNYDPRFWTAVVRDFIEHYDLTENSRVLDVGAAKGFMMYEFKQALPNMKIWGIDISQYAVDNAMVDVKPYITKGNAKDLGIFEDREFDLVISINTIHNLELEDCKKAIKEIQRVGKTAFICVDAWRNDEEKFAMIDWNLTAKTYMSVYDWKRLFDELGYTGDYYWFIP